MNRIDRLNEQWKEEELLLPIWMKDKEIYIIDQIALPEEVAPIAIKEVSELGKAIKDMTIRGSGAIGISGIYGMLLALVKSKGDREAVVNAGEELKTTRPTALNLMKTIDRLIKFTNEYKSDDFYDAFYNKACDMLEEQLSFERKLGRNGAELINDGDSILTHCHSGALAGSGFGGRAFSVIRTAHEQGKKIHVYTSETRPYLQGARITSFELEKFGIPHTLITDGMSGYLMQLGKIDKVVVGSDRVAANGDLINKVGTYMHAVAANENNIPFYTATSSHTIDFDLKQGMDIGVEFRKSEEVSHFNGKLITTANTEALYPAFDITPNKLIAGIITEAGVMKQPYTENLKRLNK